MILNVTSTRDIPSLDREPRNVHASGVWFADATGMATYRMDFHLWSALGQPKSIDVDFGLPDETIEAAQALGLQVAAEREESGTPSATVRPAEAR